MKQLTIRGFEPELEKRLRRLADQERLALNKAVLRLLRQATGLNEKPQHNRVGNSLNKFIGCWTREEEEEFLKGIESVEMVDEALWS